MSARSRVKLALVCGGPLLLMLSCGRAPEPAPRPQVAALMPEAMPARALIVAEDEGPAGAEVMRSARALAMLVEHFDEVADIVPAGEFDPADLGRHRWAFYLAGPGQSLGRGSFAAAAAGWEGTVVWVGPGLEALGREALARLGLAVGEGAGAEPQEWTLSYGGQRHVERVAVPEVRAGEGAQVLAGARRAGVEAPFLAGEGRLWYVAAGPLLERHRFWSACIWADGLHEMMGIRHEEEGRRLVPVLREVPVWVSETQVPSAVRPFLEAGLPVAVLAWTQMGEVTLADRPEATRGLREAEALGATVVLAADEELDAREQFRLAWEVGLRPIGWAGPEGADNPFRLRIAGCEKSPPYCAGGLLPAPIAVSDAGRIAPADERRLQMLEVVRDAVALVSFGLWAPPGPFREIISRQERAGWRTADLRDFGVSVREPRRTLLSGNAVVRLPSGSSFEQTVYGPRWQVVGRETVTAPEGGTVQLALRLPAGAVAALEPVRRWEEREFVKGVTLDPCFYAGLGMDAETLAEELAERYARYGVNTVFMYAYNVNEGAAYRTRYRGARLSEWGRQDLLGKMLEACQARGIRVVAWLYSGRDRGMWEAHPEWRERTESGREYNPLRLHTAHFLCPRNPQVRRWYVGLLRDLARRYPTLDGIELCEPVVNWFGTHACHCEVCRREFAQKHPGEPVGEEVWRKFRAQGLTEFLSECIRAIQAEGIDAYIMTISDAWSNGAILTPRRQAAESGFDLEALLEGPHPPDWVNFEIIWQQWAAIYGEEMFSYDWAEETARRLVRRTDGRARVLMHVELVDFGAVEMTPERLATTIKRVAAAEPAGLDCYHSRALDEREGWEALRDVYEGLP